MLESIRTNGIASGRHVMGDLCLWTSCTLVKAQDEAMPATVANRMSWRRPTMPWGWARIKSWSGDLCRNYSFCNRIHKLCVWCVDVFIFYSFLLLIRSLFLFFTFKRATLQRCNLSKLLKKWCMDQKQGSELVPVIHTCKCWLDWAAWARDASSCLFLWITDCTAASTCVITWEKLCLRHYETASQSLWSSSHQVLKPIQSFCLNVMQPQHV